MGLSSPRRFTRTFCWCLCDSDGNLIEAFIKGSDSSLSSGDSAVVTDKPTSNSSGSVDETSPLNKTTKGSDSSLYSGDSAVVSESDGSLNAALIKADKPTTNSSGSVDETSPLNKTTKGSDSSLSSKDSAVALPDSDNQSGSGGSQGSQESLSSENSKQQ
ncbi:hypothetical protein OJAV_G00113760 [Oryzias javanicus]|uniref:Uncharacterized protein n=1 Tax=Oryzias javanicus TaxID=123683 RepID=A0A3S2MUF8_ORYJA|nr:hypothetical protein OJAV_G00113760 [Oryzias javanicus]